MRTNLTVLGLAPLSVLAASQSASALEAVYPHTSGSHCHQVSPINGRVYHVPCPRFSPQISLMALNSEISRIQGLLRLLRHQRNRGVFLGQSAFSLNSRILELERQLGVLLRLRSSMLSGAIPRFSL